MATENTAAASGGARSVTIATYYKFVQFPEYREFQGPLRECCEANSVKGMILLAEEGVNSTMAGPRAGVDAVLDFLQSHPVIGPLTVKVSYTDENPFRRLKVRLKKEIVSLGVPDVSPAAHPNNVGEYVAPEAWNDLIRDPNVVLIDTRNDYECELGTFRGAVDPRTKSFREFPEFAARELEDKKDRPIAMFCTGGIRCEKSTSYLVQQGFRKVYHLQGGILKYLETVPPERSMWEGDCFVFDRRVAVNHSLTPAEGLSTCFACRHTLTPADRQHAHFADGVSCQYCFDSRTEQQRRAAAERQRQVEIHRELQRPHIGATSRDIEAVRALKVEERERLKQKQRDLLLVRERQRQQQAHPHPQEADDGTHGYADDASHQQHKTAVRGATVGDDGSRAQSQQVSPAADEDRIPRPAAAVATAVAIPAPVPTTSAAAAASEVDDAP